MMGFSIPQKFSPRNGHFYHSVKVFSLESFPLYGNTSVGWKGVSDHPLTCCLGDCLFGHFCHNFDTGHAQLNHQDLMTVSCPWFAQELFGLTGYVWNNEQIPVCLPK